MKVLVVNHPFLRLAKAYLNLMTLKEDKNVEILKSMCEETTNLSFKVRQKSQFGLFMIR